MPNNEARDNEARDEVIASERWAFDSEVTTVFDDMLERSIPQYQTMRRLVHEIGRRFAFPKASIVDIGCSRGEALAPFVEQFGAYNRYLGLEISDPMLDAARERFRLEIDAGIVEIRKADLREDFHALPTSLTLSVLTLMFVPIEYRQRLVSKIYESLIPGGALILVEKLVGQFGLTDELFEEIYLDLKADSGYTKEQIERKKLSLEGVLVPLSAEWNEALLTNAGFVVEPFWRWANFGGWLAVKR